MAVEMQFGAVVVCGGRSRRMGRDKWSLPFGPETMLERVIRIVRTAVTGPIVVVTAPGRTRPARNDVVWVCDEREGRGPLEGLYAGLKTAAAERCEAVYAVGCDVPLLRVEFVRAVCAALGAFDAVTVRNAAGMLNPLAAAYRPAAVLPKIAELLAADRLRARGLFELVAAHPLDADELCAADPELESLRNVNTPDDYAAALQKAGFSPPP